MPVTQRYKLNIVPEGTPVVVHASQYDAQSRDFYFTIYNGSELFEIPTGSAVTVRGTKPDNTGFEYSATYSGSLVHVIVEAQMTVLPGNVRSEIRITNGAQILGTANFILRVESAGLSDDTQISETQIPLLEEALQKAAEVEQIYEDLGTLPAIGDSIFTPQIFGAQGGLADDTQAFNDMFSEARSQNKKVFIKEDDYLLTELMVADDSVVVFNEGNFPGEKLLVSKKIKDSLSAQLYRAIPITNAEIAGRDDMYAQGACYDSNAQQVVFVYVTGADDGDAVVLIYDKTMTNLVFEKTFNRGTIGAPSHFNDLTFNSNTNRIYTIQRSADGNVYAFNPSNFNLEQTIALDFGGEIPKRISYDEKNNLYFIHGDNFLKIYDSSFQLKKTINYTLSNLESDSGKTEGSLLMQGSEVVDDNFLFLWTRAINGIMPDFYISQINYEGNSTKATFEFTSLYANDELQGLLTIDKTLYAIASHGRQIVVYSIDLANVNRELTSGTCEVIPSGADLNDYFNVGTYICGGNSIAESLTNCPTKLAFRMYVLPNSTGSYYDQIIIDITGNIYLRYYRVDLRQWYESDKLNVIRESGSTNSWNYSIFSNGDFDAKVSKSNVSVASWTAVGNGYVSPKLTIALPFDQSRISSYIAVGSANQYCALTNFTMNGGNLEFYAVCPQNTATQINVRLMLHGRATL